MSDTQTVAFREQFRDLSSRYLNTVLTCTAGVPVVIECYGTDEDAFQRECQRVSGLESDCDALLGEIRTTVGDSMPPNFTGVYFQPESVLELFAHIDEIANYAERFCAELAAMQPALTDTERADFVRMADLVVEGTETLVDATGDVRAALCGSGIETAIGSQVSTVARLESACDTARDKLLSAAFADEATPAALVVRELIVTLEEAMDAVEDAANHLAYVDSAIVETGDTHEGIDW
ncbi:DUF47 domain-containing protein [Halorientalis salina]|uniref:DUF47 domain-containing protein n=1 Tax=Halorientalis salina TaxID=2932266 RepID=UPI0010AD9445|nr:DUF47 family protein [Halorientalis salina]